MGFIQKILNSHKKTVGILIILVIIFAIPLTVYVSQQQQQIRQRAALLVQETQASLYLSPYKDCTRQDPPDDAKTGDEISRNICINNDQDNAIKINSFDIKIEFPEQDFNINLTSAGKPITVGNDIGEFPVANSTVKNTLGFFPRQTQIRFIGAMAKTKWILKKTINLGQINLTVKTTESKKIDIKFTTADIYGPEERKGQSAQERKLNIKSIPYLINVNTISDIGTPTPTLAPTLPTGTSSLPSVCSRIYGFVFNDKDSDLKIGGRDVMVEGAAIDISEDNTNKQANRYRTDSSGFYDTTSIYCSGTTYSVRLSSFPDRFKGCALNSSIQPTFKMLNEDKRFDITLDCPTPTLTSAPTDIPTLTPALIAACPSTKSKGDANCDGKIDIKDFYVWKEEFILESKGETKSDFNNDKQITIEDFSIWRDGFLNLTVQK